MNTSLYQAASARSCPCTSRKSSIRSYSVPFTPTVSFQRRSSESPSDDGLILTAVKIASPFRRQSLEEQEDLPVRPTRRSFFRRLSTRWHASQSSEEVRLVKVPRREHQRYFARDYKGNYIGTEPERLWNEEEVEAMFGQYQDRPMLSLDSPSVYSHFPALRHVL
ncbi:hypothetical protein D0859_01928 [Hortaea werneckii]|uniref:Uncharacterized protein n=1 Tax=Hortaea werneckii TaxID=91943 RepID=A0A3M7J856_HORWE|nr:hypothetical protein D0859_01928 [Hortaea werneckii]